MADKWTVQSNVEELQRKLLRWSRVAPNELRKALGVGAEMIRKEVQYGHLNGPKMPRGMGDPVNATLFTTGKWRLRNSINYRINVEPGRFSAIIGTNIPYGRKHEFGLSGMPYRPFLRPSLEKMRPAAFDYLEEALMKSYGK